MNKVEWLIRQEERRECEEEKKQALAQAAKRYEMEKRQADENYKKVKQAYEAKIQSMIKWITDQGYTEEVLSDLLK